MQSKIEDYSDWNAFYDVLTSQFGENKVEEFFLSLKQHPIIRLHTYGLPRRSQRFQPVYIERFVHELNGMCKFYNTNVHDKRFPAGFVAEGEPTAQEICPEGYELWLDMFEDATGSNYFAFYPLGARKGKPIKVLFHGHWFKIAVDWKHGDRGLFHDHIYPLCFWESFVYADARYQEIIDWIESKISKHEYAKHNAE